VQLPLLALQLLIEAAAITLPLGLDCSHRLLGRCGLRPRRRCGLLGGAACPLGCLRLLLPPVQPALQRGRGCLQLACGAAAARLLLVRQAGACLRRRQLLLELKGLVSQGGRLCRLGRELQRVLLQLLAVRCRRLLAHGSVGCLRGRLSRVEGQDARPAAAMGGAAVAAVALQGQLAAAPEAGWRCVLHSLLPLVHGRRIQRSVGSSSAR
jgi:hypothetical protein